MANRSKPLKSTSTLTFTQARVIYSGFAWDPETSPGNQKWGIYTEFPYPISTLVHQTVCKNKNKNGGGGRSE